MKSVDKLMKKNKYGELEFADFERGKQKLFKPIKKADFLEGNNTRRGVSRRKRVSKVSVSPHQIRKRMNFNFSNTCKDIGTGKSKGVNREPTKGKRVKEGKEEGKEAGKKERGRNREGRKGQFRMKRNGIKHRQSKFGMEPKQPRDEERVKVGCVFLLVVYIKGGY